MNTVLNSEEIAALHPREGDLPSSAQARVHTMVEARLGVAQLTHNDFEKILVATIIEIYSGQLDHA